MAALVSDGADDAPMSLKMFHFLLERDWESGETTRETAEVEAFGQEYARTILMNKMDQPAGLSAERVIEVVINTAGGMQ